MQEERAIGHECKVICNMIKREFKKSAAFDKLEHLTGTHGWIIKYLYEHREEDVYQRDIENNFSIRRSTVTGILQLMEKNGLIIRESVENDARLKKLRLTEKAIDLHYMIEESIAETEKKICEGITEEEKEIFFRITEKIRNNLDDRL